MSEEDSSHRRDWKTTFGVGCLVGVFLAMVGILLFSQCNVGDQSVLSALTLQTGSIVDISGSEPEYTLRLIQAIGILLPLFTGLLRLTTSDESEVSEGVNRYLFLGILALVFGGSTAVIGGMVSDMAGVLRIALGFVLLAFGVIAFAAGRMFREMPTEADTLDEQKQRELDDEEIQTPKLNREQDETEDDRPEDEDATSTPTESETEVEDSATETKQRDDTESEAELAPENGSE